ncbi:MAG: hypothetical protein RSG96_06600, partial [Clostridia bacterium]
VYSFQLDVVGRSVGEQELALLHSIVSRTLRLGAPSPESQPLMLAELPTLSTENAIVTTDNSDIQISLDPIPSVIGTNQLVITGATDPAAKLRLKFDGNTSSAISPAEDGSFSITAKNLNNGQPNELGIAVRLDKLTTELAFTVMVDWQQLPLVLSTLSATSYQDQFTVEGLTLPGAEVQVVKGGTTSSLTVDENGRFSILLTTKKDAGLPPRGAGGQNSPTDRRCGDQSRREHCVCRSGEGSRSLCGYHRALRRYGYTAWV